MHDRRNPTRPPLAVLRALRPTQEVRHRISYAAMDRIARKLTLEKRAQSDDPEEIVIDTLVDDAIDLDPHRESVLRNYTAADMTFTPDAEWFNRIASEIKARRARGDRCCILPGSPSPSPRSARPRARRSASQLPE